MPGRKSSPPDAEEDIPGIITKTSLKDQLPNGSCQGGLDHRLEAVKVIAQLSFTEEITRSKCCIQYLGSQPGNETDKDEN